MKKIDFTRVRAVMFDLDGTLVDSVPDLSSAIDTMMAQLSLPLCGEKKVRSWVGDGANALIFRALEYSCKSSPSEQIFAQAKPIFFNDYQQNICRFSRLYPGVSDGLKAIAELGLPMACVTNKPALLAKPLLEALGIGHYFCVTIGGECATKKKPAPEPLLMAAKSLGLDIDHCIMVGDSSNDLMAAGSAGCAAVYVPYGYNAGFDIRQITPDVIVEDIVELSALLKIKDASVA
jgi:phosphoglycolate phosphatase